MEKIIRKNRKLNNTGMTLVEVIVAIAILSIAILPLMYSFIYTAKFNMKSRERQRSTSAAQAIMEKFKGYSYEQICDEVADGSFRVGQADVTTSSIVYSGTDTYFVLQNVNFEVSSSTVARYDALVKVNRYQNDAEYAGILPDFEDSNPYADAVYRGLEDYDEDAMNAIASQIQTEWNGINASYGNAYPDEVPNGCTKIRRRIELGINESGSATSVTVHLYYQADTEYEFDSTKPKMLKHIDLLYSDANYTDVYPSFKIYDNAATGTDLKNIYIYYYPLYEGIIRYRVNKDDIYINNNTSTVYNVYLYKQRRSGMNLATMYSKEAANADKVDIYISPNLYFTHNMNLNIGDEDLTDTVTFNDTLRIHRYAGATPAPTATPGSTTTKDIFSDIEVQIYRAGSVSDTGAVAPGSECLADIKGTFNAK